MSASKGRSTWAFFTTLPSRFTEMVGTPVMLMRGFAL